MSALPAAKKRHQLEKICEAVQELEFQVNIILNSLHLMWSIFMYSSSFAFRSTSLCRVVELKGKYCNRNFHASPLTSGLKPPKNVACKLVGKIHKQQPIWYKVDHLTETTVVLTPGFEELQSPSYENKGTGEIKGVWHIKLYWSENHMQMMQWITINNPNIKDLLATGELSIWELPASRVGGE